MADHGFGGVLDDLVRWVRALRLRPQHVAEAWFDLFGEDENGVEVVWRTCGYTSLTGADLRARVLAAIEAVLQDPSSTLTIVDRVQMFVRVRTGVGVARLRGRLCRRGRASPSGSSSTARGRRTRGPSTPRRAPRSPTGCAAGRA